MNTFDLRKYLAENKLFENEDIISEISDTDIIKAIAKAADVSPKELVAKAKESEGENVDDGHHAAQCQRKSRSICWPVTARQQHCGGGEEPGPSRSHNRHRRNVVRS